MLIKGKMKDSMNNPEPLLPGLCVRGKRNYGGKLYILVKSMEPKTPLSECQKVIYV